MKQKILLALGCVLMASGAWATDYTLTLYADGCSSPNKFTCSSGQQLSVSAKASLPGSYFVRWSDGNTSATRTITMNSNKTLTAYFSDLYTITLESAGNGVVSNDTTVHYNSSIQISATPDYGYRFSSWNDGYTSNPRTVTVTADKTYTATFVKRYFKLTVNSSDIKQGTVSGSGSYEYQSERTITATPEYGYHFDSWSDGNTENPRVVTLLSDTTITAFFAPDTFSLAVLYDSVMGSVTGAGEYLYGDTAYVNSTPNYGYHFKSVWYHGTAYDYQSATLVVKQNDTVSVTFEKNTYRVSATGDHGYIRGTGGYLYLDSARLTVEPYPGYAFDSWADGVTDNPRSVFVTQDTTLSAHFVMLYEGKCGDDLTWKYNKGVLTISGTGDMYNYSASGNYDSAPWKAFRDSITKVVLPDGLTKIGNYAFYNCKGFTSIVIPNSVMNIGEYAFSGCSNLTTVSLGNGLTSIGRYAFDGCSKLRYITSLAEYAPTVSSNTFPSYNAILKVPCDVMIFYQGDDIWGQFKYIQCIEAEEAVVTTTTVVPAETDATFAWPTSEGANTYILKITKDGVVFCTLTFNANGQLLNIAFAPGRDGAAHAPEAELTATGYQFTVTGLESGSTYAYTLDAKDAGNNVVANYTGTFTTTGGEMGVESVNKYVNTPTKVVREGQVLILRGEKMYDLRGQEVK